MDGGCVAEDWGAYYRIPRYLVIRFIFRVCGISMMGLYLLAYDIFGVYDLVGAKKMYYTLRIKSEQFW